MKPNIVRRRIAVLFGGTWEERDVSIDSARQVVEGLRRIGHRVQPVRWDDDGWVVLADTSDEQAKTKRSAAPAEVVVAELKEQSTDVVFNALHGGPGEDGSVRGFFDVCDLACTGSPVHGSAVTLDKESFRRHARALDIPIAPGVVIDLDAAAGSSATDAHVERVASEVGFPCVIKPVRSGSSCGVVLAGGTTELRADFESRSDRVLVEGFVGGREFSVPCVETRHAGVVALPVIEIESLTDAGFFDLEAKYSPGRARETVPASIDDGLREQLQSHALTIHRDLDLGGISRTDFIVGAGGPVVLESNTIPGFTQSSLLPQCAVAAGWTFEFLVNEAVEIARASFDRRKGVHS